MPVQKKKSADLRLVREWALPPAATLGSSVRARGILLELRACLPFAARKWLDLDAGMLALRTPKGSEGDCQALSESVSKWLEGIESLPVIPREIEDILAISTTERHRWLKDGRLPSAGTRTVKLRGRARSITFHVFDPRKVEDMLDGDLIATWREEDAMTAAENRRRATWKRRLSRTAEPSRDAGAEDVARPGLIGWEEFERDGPLR